MLLTFNYKDGTQTVRFEDALTVDGVEGKVRICPALLDHKSNDFTLEIVGFFVFGLTSFGFDHNFDHNAKDFIWSIAGTPALIECLR